jgi:hypothetical protein
MNYSFQVFPNFQCAPIIMLFMFTHGVAKESYFVIWKSCAYTSLAKYMLQNSGKFDI